MTVSIHIQLKVGGSVTQRTEGSGNFFFFVIETHRPSSLSWILQVPAKFKQFITLQNIIVQLLNLTDTKSLFVNEREYKFVIVHPKVNCHFG